MCRADFFFRVFAACFPSAVRVFFGNRFERALTSGVLSREPMKGSASISMVNAGLEGFVRAAAIEFPRDPRINAISPPWVIETVKTLGMHPAIGIPAEEVARAYVTSVEGTGTGQILDPRKPAS